MLSSSNNVTEDDDEDNNFDVDVGIFEFADHNDHDEA